MPRTHPLRLIPWLVTLSDLSRYLGRALDQCSRGRVLFITHRIRSGGRYVQGPLVGLTPYTGFPGVFEAACADFNRGRFCEVKLSAMRRKVSDRRSR